MKQKGKGKVFCWFQFGSQDLNGSERVRSGKDLRLIFPHKWGRRKGCGWGLRKEGKKIHLYLRSVFGGVFYQMVRPTFQWVSGEKSSPGTEVHDTFWDKAAWDVYEDGWGETWLSAHGCLVALEVSSTTWGVCSGWLLWHRTCGRPVPIWRCNWRLPKGFSGGISCLVWVTESIPLKNAHLIAKLLLRMCNLSLF